MSDERGLARWPESEAMARAWVVRLKSGEATDADVDALLNWRAQSEGNESAFRQAVHLWDQLGAPLAGLSAPSAAARQPVPRRWFLGGGAALAAATALAVIPVAAPVPAGAREYRTVKGERRAFALAADVRADLNTDSRLFFWDNARAPRVEVARGEALIAAACGPDRQLTALAEDVEVRARVARFVLRSEGGVSRVSCIEGALHLRSDGGWRRLGAGQSLDIADGRVVATPAADVGAAWQRDLLLFKDRPAGAVVAELNRYRPGRVILLGSRNDVRISGVIHLGRTDAAVDHIARSLGMKVTRLPGDIAILRN